MTTPSRRPRLCTVKEFAHAYRVTERTVYQWMRVGAVQVARLGPRLGVRIVVDEDSPIVFTGPVAQSTTTEID